MVVNKESQWREISFDPSELILKTEIDGEHVEVMMSPYDVPEALRLSRGAGPDWYVIEFRYLQNDEGRKRFPVTKDLFYYVGESSCRLYAIEFNLNSEIWQKSERPSRLKWAEVDRLIKKIVEDQKKPRKAPSYSLAKKAIFKNRGDLVPA